ncbi:MAG: hypothetical protein CMA88_01090 [Euryarchaeota archaeon]|nr:hypothetical protein [Euryarchaeota archaeon]
MDIVILASASSRRRSWLSERIGGGNVELEFCELDGSEPPPRAGVEVKEQVFKSCMHKAKVASSTIERGDPRARIIVVSDTLVEDPDDHLVALGKPIDRASAASTLIRLSGRRHVVWSSTAILDRGAGEIELDRGWKASSWTAFSIVEFEEIQEEDMVGMLDSGAWKGKAGGYDLAGKAGEFSRVVEGEEVTVLGFSAEAISDLEDRLARRM